MAKNQIGSLDLNLILVFDALLQHRSVTRAARVNRGSSKKVRSRASEWLTAL